MRCHTHSSLKPSQPLRLICVAVILAIAWTSPFASAEPTPRELVSEANEALSAGDYGKALQGYEQAAEIEPEALEIAYDQGIAYYRMGDYERAAEYFSRALSAEDASLDAKARFNLGNSAYATALQQQQTDAQAAIAKLEEATNRYREALDITPKDLDARANIERAQRLKELLLEQMQQQPQQQQQDQDQQQDERQEQQQSQQDQQESQDQQQEQQSQSEEQQQPEQQAEQEQQGREQQQEPQQGEQQQQQQMQQQDENAEQPQGEAKAMSREEAERLLQMIRDQERQRREDQARRKRARQVPVQRDW